MLGIKKEIAAYERMRDDLELEHLGEWVVMHDEKLVGTYADFQEAAADAVQRFGHGPYLIQTNRRTTADTTSFCAVQTSICRQLIVDSATKRGSPVGTHWHSTGRVEFYGIWSVCRGSSARRRSAPLRPYWQSLLAVLCHDVRGAHRHRHPQ